MSRCPIVEKRRRKTIRKRLARKAARELERRRAGGGAPPEPELSKTAARKAAREEMRIQERDRRKAEHKLSFFARVFGLGRGPAALRMKWLDRLLGK